MTKNILTPSTTATRNPVIFTVIGRPRVGKTSLLNALAQIVQAQGGAPEIWSTDALNYSLSLSKFHETHRPSENETSHQRQWLEAKIHSLKESRNDVILDIGSDWTDLHDVLSTMDFEQMGITLSVVFLMSEDRSDIDYLEDIQTNRHFFPRNSAIIINEGVLPPLVDIADVYKIISVHPAVTKALQNGSEIFLAPFLGPMSEICDRGLSFKEYAEAGQKEGFPTTSIFDRLATDRWYRHDFPELLSELGTSRLPYMPKGLSVPAGHNA